MGPCNKISHIRIWELKCTVFLQSNNFIPWQTCYAFESSAMSETWMSLPLTKRKTDFYQQQTCHFWIRSFERLFTRCGENACSCIFFSASCGKCMKNNVSVKSWIFIINTLQRCICKYDIFNVSQIDSDRSNLSKWRETDGSKHNIYVQLLQCRAVVFQNKYLHQYTSKWQE